ncbi:hypothetical protein HNY73_023253 [Argiope bruennichi]|uniref:Uncharacterized protein n=1 Tax=Argiope bruennichi TaxID=94029 RepID=A0A8T0E3I8_ARGBR|nr:hypothetical protein HNY73_023253 [Argiope bruennichi]
MPYLKLSPSVGVGASSSTYANCRFQCSWTILSRSGYLNAANAGFPFPSSFASALFSSAASVASSAAAQSHPRVKQLSSAFSRAGSQSASQSAARSGAQSSSTTTPHPPPENQAASQFASKRCLEAVPLHSHSILCFPFSLKFFLQCLLFGPNFPLSSRQRCLSLGVNVANTLGIGNAPGLGNAFSQASLHLRWSPVPARTLMPFPMQFGQFFAGQGFFERGNAGSLASSFASALSASAASVASSAAAQSASQSQAAASAFSRAASQSASQSAARSGAQSSSTTTTTSASGSQAASQSASSAASQASASSFAQASSASLAASSSFSSAFSSANSLSALGNVAYQLGFNVANTLGIGNAPGLGNALSQAVSSVGVGALPARTLKPFPMQFGQFLAGQGILNAGNAGSLASSFANALSNSALSVGSRVSSPSYGALSPIAAGPNFISTGLNVGVASVGRPFASLSQSLPTSFQTGLGPIVSSSGLGSSAATARGSSLANPFASAISSSGGSLSVPTFLNLLSSVGAQVSSSSSLSSSEVTTQVLLEAIAALLQVINGAQITSVNFSNVSNVNRALVDSLVGPFA